MRASGRPHRRGARSWCGACCWCKSGFTASGLPSRAAWAARPFPPCSHGMIGTRPGPRTRRLSPGTSTWPSPDLRTHLWLREVADFGNDQAGDDEVTVEAVKDRDAGVMQACRGRSVRRAAGQCHRRAPSRVRGPETACAQVVLGVLGQVGQAAPGSGKRQPAPCRRRYRARGISRLDRRWPADHKADDDEERLRRGRTELVHRAVELAAVHTSRGNASSAPADFHPERGVSDLWTMLKQHGRGVGRIALLWRHAPVCWRGVTLPGKGPAGGRAARRAAA
jgi:hypothetical protein